MKMRNSIGISLIAATALLGGCASSNAEVAPQPAVEAAPVDPAPIRPAEQWLFGSAEATILISQSYQAMTDFVVTSAKSRKARRSVILAGRGDLFDPHFTNCDRKPNAVVFDADETLIWNVGQARWAAENGKEFDPKIWDEWERTGEGKVVAMPGAVDAVTKLRAAGIKIIANTNRDAKNAAQTAATLKTAGFGDFTHGETLFLKGDDTTGSSKDSRRAVIAEKYCVIAMVGDQLGDFANGFNDKTLTVEKRRALAVEAPISHLWGKGWFLLPNPTYGPWDRAKYDDIFPANTRWEPTEGR